MLVPYNNVFVLKLPVFTELTTFWEGRKLHRSSLNPVFPAQKLILIVHIIHYRNRSEITFNLLKKV